ncbi:MAG: TlpA family protein disulfide reductase [Fibromonadaceae bacterium]|jgi:thiol-disulfide isomerase/thioredoxin|nr:TlpA family protein disulfide reductase [Fibromonadaceae bacterium]
MGTKMHRLIFIACIAFFANLSFAEGKPSVRLPLPKELMSDIPWFALVTKNGEDSYSGVLSKEKLKSIAQQKNSQRVVFAFYATWCIPCKEGIAKMSANAAELESGGVLVVLINVGETDYAKTDKWVRGYMKDSWLLGFDRFNNIPESFGLSKKGDSQMPLPKTLLLDQDLRPILLLGNEGDDFPLILRD